ncbi:SDR family oxidoreductase [Streptomyces spectabilis]|uniref:NAD(P)-dependent dehydrogenase (Short-subunit alcohol dehydrogenase family) n=1 Tax=Streptomyces spectabilis TaxID=68270 RepID=A0A5P2XFQ6_STRST|nr:SDR family oxidoreductase [Streptomyces spectabilis]MBB5104628.1 NAD(P)-dependent dehydrogenase (short-subunit alcohol dehydrogenase family) [Streptomyces spectabilis]MCI3905019.1 SDR family oxidoreductase [Streptomyces spectabilis]QEV62045.1 SDR family oxidoreductase [Streptomyces spectabilis]GGV01181.1 oxidoreductase [Streptomyces spectabilis]
MGASKGNATGTASGEAAPGEAGRTAGSAAGRLAGRTALVTGGSRGIGRGIAERLGRDGARVAVHYGSNEAAAKETVAAIERAGGSAFAIGAELGRPGDAEALWTAFDAHADGVDILVNNAGIGTSRPFADTDEAEFDRLFAVNTKAPYFITQLATERLRDGGRIINISSGVSRAAVMPDILTYAMTKGALDVFTRNLSKVLGPRGITVNSVAPGVVDTDVNAAWLRGEENEAARAGAAALSALGKVGTVEDIADVVAFLASPDGRWVTGQWLDATGGSLA